MIRQRSSSEYQYVIMLSSQVEKHLVVEGLAAGADDYLISPYEPQEMFFRLRVAERLLALQGRDVIIFSLAKLAESRDRETGAHLERMREYCLLLTQLLEKTQQYQDIVDADYIALIYLTSPLHDIGKVGIPDNVLLKPGKLTCEEFEIMKTHTLIGGETLQAAAEKQPGHNYLRMACEIAMTHHEKFDGSGYPNQLVGTQIPLCGRIVAIADAYDALTSKRVYKEAYTHQFACDTIRADAGTHFDPNIAEVFLQHADLFDQIRRSFQCGADETGKSDSQESSSQRPATTAVSNPGRPSLLRTRNPDTRPNSFATLTES